MRYIIRPSFRKSYKKLSRQTQTKVDVRLRIFFLNESNPILNNHELHGKYNNHRSINITGDYRAIFFIQDNIAIFTGIGTHSELFGR